MRTQRTLLAFLGVLLCSSFVAFAQTGSVRGIVSDAGTNEPLMGVTVLVIMYLLSLLTGTLPYFKVIVKTPVFLGKAQMGA